MSQDRNRWRVSSRATLKWREWDGEWIVFHPDSGDTHLLDPFAARVLERLEAAPADAATLVQRLAESPAAPPAGDLPSMVEQLLRVFDDAGLIEPVDDPA